MQTPRFANPHLLDQSLQTVTRAQLALGTDADSDDIAPDEEEDQQVLSRLDSLISASLQVGENSDVLDETRPKKRKRLNGEAQREDAKGVLPFRLLSRALPPAVVCLSPRPPPPPPKFLERAYEDTEGEANARRRNARGVAVEHECIFDASSASLRTCRPAIDLRSAAIDLNHSPELLLLEVSKTTTSKPNGVPTIATKHASSALPSPHTPHSNPSTCPTAAIDEPLPSRAFSKPSKRRHRRRVLAQSQAPPRQPPAFWRPDPVWRGKSAGYALGYPGSAPLPIDDPFRARYVRDEMRKGVYAP